MRKLSQLRSIQEWERTEGSPSPLGVTWVEAEQAWNFALFSRHATAVTLLLYGEKDSVQPVLQISLDPVQNKTTAIWHCFVSKTSAPHARYYGYRIEGPRDPEPGHRFDSRKILLDPFAAGVYFPKQFSRKAASNSGPNDGQAPLGVLPGPVEAFDWGEWAPPRHEHDTIVYELHVKGFTARANSGVSAERRGTFLGLIDKIPYLKDLGVTVVELLPVQQFDPQEGNYWGYMTLNFFAPHQGYAVREAVREFREMVRAFHEAGIEVWLDVVYNHTAEGDQSGPTYSMRGVDNASYYLVQPDGQYRNDSGCGNTTRCAHPITRVLVLRSLRYWAEQMHVDGFRFDLASVFARDIHGNVDTSLPALVHEIGAMAAQLDVRVIAEAWDIGAYLLGRGFPGLAWRQWNGQFRDDVRAFVKGDTGKVGPLMARLYGSDDLFPDQPGDVYHPYQSVNFLTAHDGFCLYDLVSYNHKHNQANGHNNSDGCENNLSWNCGTEGDENVSGEVVSLRRRQVKNFFALLLLANGTPMFCAGDEFLNSQGGNNNPYNQDNETTWLDWDRLGKNPDIFRFFKGMIALRKSRRMLGRSRFWREDVHWYGANGNADLSPDSRSLAWRLRGGRFNEADLYVMINSHEHTLRFHIQEGDSADWQRIVDTNLESPLDIVKPGKESTLASLDYDVAPRSVVILSGHSPKNNEGGDFVNPSITENQAPRSATRGRPRSTKSKT
jgi:glycogen operon protein